ncbi:hypothetical protein C0J52_22298 [Blattella germanica]|nr:hypothetical protein C0J52_22298 [Blattella germanica]
MGGVRALWVDFLLLFPKATYALLFMLVEKMLCLVPTTSNLNAVKHLEIIMMLYAVVKINKPAHLAYKIDSILATQSFSTTPLELNSIELIWATVKNLVSEKNVTFQIHDLIQLVDKKN